MFKNIFKIAFRNLLKDRFYSLLNVLGLSIGIAASLLIMLYVVDELSYDDFHNDADRIYRVGAKGKFGENEVVRMAVTCAPLANGLLKHIPEVESVTRLASNVIIFNHNEEIFKEVNVFYADSTFFNVFSFELQEGDKRTALIDPYSLVLTEASAIRYFGQESLSSGNVIGQLIKSGDNTYKVTGIIENIPHNSHFDFEMLVSMSTFQDAYSSIWINMRYYTYAKLHRDVHVDQLDGKFRGMVMQYVIPQVMQYMNYPGRSITEENVDENFQFFLQPLTDIHLKSNLTSELGSNGNIQYIYVFSIISIFIILIACINFMNLSTARSAKRAKEVGIRKTLGSDRYALIWQFYLESFLFIIIAMLIALGLTEAFRGPFNVIAQKELAFNIFTQPWILGVIVCLILVITFLAGSYPAIYLTRFSIIQVLGGALHSGSKKSIFRNGLVIFQFMISIGLIISTIIVYKQLHYIQNKDLGFEKENVIILNNGWDVGKLKDPLKQEILNNENVVSASYATRLPSDTYGSNAQKAEGDNEQDHRVNLAYVDYNYDKTLGLSLKHGRFFSEDFPSDSAAIIINEAAAHIFGYSGNDCADAIGKKIEMINTRLGNRIKYEVVGVVKDYNFEGLQSKIEPLSLCLYHNTGFLTIRLKPGNTKAMLSNMEKIWKEHVPWLKFDYNFLDEKFARTFEREERLSSIFSIFTILAIIVGCLGLFGLAAYTAEQRTKEIGIRKAMGATSNSVVNMLNKEFTKLVLVAFVLVVPITWYLMDKWLEVFAYKTPIGIWPFFIGGAVAILIAWMTVSYQSIKAAIANPVDSLRNE
jgi:putative ABC transport system permease protein